jgi:hypothetical protein
VYCIFCRANDLPALWAYRGLKERGLAPLEIFTPEALVYNRRLEHRLWAGEAITRIDLADGRTLDGARVRGVLNRIHTLPTEHFRFAESGDREYAGQEQSAIHLSWMYSLPGAMINRPGPRGLYGDQRSPAEWTWLAAQAGLPVLPFHQGDDRPPDYPPENAASQLIVLDGKIYGARAQWCDETFSSLIERLVELSGLRLLSLGFLINPAGEPFFATATALPDLTLGGEALLDALMAVFA